MTHDDAVRKSEARREAYATLLAKGDAVGFALLGPIEYSEQVHGEMNALMLACFTAAQHAKLVAPDDTATLIDAYIQSLANAADISPETPITSYLLRETFKPRRAFYLAARRDLGSEAARKEFEDIEALALAAAAELQKPKR